MVAWYRANADAEWKADENAVYGLMESLLAQHPREGLAFAKEEFARSSTLARRMFLLAVNSFSIAPDLWDDLAALMPPDVAPDMDYFSEHFRIGRNPGPERIVAAAKCLRDPEMRLAYLRRVLRDGGSGWVRAAQYPSSEIQNARGEIAGLDLTDRDREEILELFDRASPRWQAASADPHGNNSSSN
jgi:hypothetical protein